MPIQRKEFYVTKEGLENLKKELDFLKKEKRPEVINAIKEARSLGDLSENTEYAAAREEQGILESKIQDLEYTIENTVLIEDKHYDKVEVGATVVLKYEDGEVDTYKIVGIKEADPFENKISNESPIAKAIMNKKENDKVIVEAPNGNYSVEILEIK